MKHRLHSICPYFAMFPATFVSEQLAKHSVKGDVVFDPFSGRGTTVLQSLLEGRSAWGIDINPVAACISGAKADPPKLQNVLSRLATLESQFLERSISLVLHSGFFRQCFHPHTLEQIDFLRSNLKWRTSKIDRFIAAVALGCLHGESHKTTNCFSNRMPRTISTKPDYSLRWWMARGLEPPERDVFEILKRMCAYRMADVLPVDRGRVALGDARNAAKHFPTLKRRISLVVTSPPYLDTTDYQEDQWLRLWFLGGNPVPQFRLNPDDRLRSPTAYWKFLQEIWSGVGPLLNSRAKIVVRIGTIQLSVNDITLGLHESLKQGLESKRVKLIDTPTRSVIANRQTDYFRPGTRRDRYEHDFTFEVH
ncbi:MAG: DNA methylase [Rhodocyclaceae bacterium]|nr:DNA methylase [Rhodocyclaceae bacterium]